jgi:hypothetical protein
VALLRFTADWGIPNEDVRLHIAGPKKVRAGDKVLLSIYVEVIGKESILPWDSVEDGLQMNGKPLIEKKPTTEWPLKFTVGGGMFSLTQPGGVLTLSYDIGPHLPYLPRPSEYKIQYGDGKTPLSSNAIVIEVVP